MAYAGLSKKILEKYKVSVGDKILLKSGKDAYEGIIMPRTELSDDAHIVLKLKSGYNRGIEISGNEKIEKLESKLLKKSSRIELQKDPKKPTISILHMGGTIASKVDYRTGGVLPQFTPEDLVSMVPELNEIANIDARAPLNVFSENIRPIHYTLMAKEICKELSKNVDGVVVPHGTDTLHFTSAALAFALRFLPVPVVLVGSQRSSDRGSSDAAQNLICAAHFAAKADFAGVVVCMHANESDEYCYIHEGTKVRKLHTSRRDAFRSVNQRPFAKVWPDGKIEFLRSDYQKRDKNRKVDTKDKFEEKVALIKSYPGFDPACISNLSKLGYKGIIFEGTGLGQLPITKIDEHTTKNAELFENIREFIDSGGFVGMASQCIYGRVQMNVYSPARDLQSIGVVPLGDMLPETAYVKLGWALPQAKTQEEAKKIMLTNYSGELTEKTDNRTFLL
ncbi:MAG: Glu-tRNA(Gln) amidotransferase subunit GatD [archaeon]